jgi:hypothetical protein
MVGRRPSVGRVEPPVAGNAPQPVRANVREPNASARHQIFDRTRDEDLAGRCLRHDPGPDVHRDSADVLAHQFALAGVEARPDLNTQFGNLVPHPGCASDGSGWTVECGKEAVPDRLDLPPAKLDERLADQRVVMLQQIPPPVVAEPAGSLGRANDVGEHHRGKDPVGLGARTHPGQKFLDLVEDRVLISRPREVVLAGEFDEPGFRDPIGEIVALLDR